ncbi:MAG: HAMP domain-containing histidine kinase, partial [Deltaproteobacteria bacterium]|nr:HAMP domain-containing histidine kinase [Deltaproteobacteria bacterium]
RVLERIFFHDVLNTVTGLQGITELLATEEDPVLVDEYIDDLQRLSAQIVEEILGQRVLLAAESGELTVEAAKVGVDALIDDVVATYRRHPVCEGHVLKIDPRPAAFFGTDAGLLRRILSNLVKNAIEATPAGGTVTVGGTILDDGSLRLAVHNPTVMSRGVKRQIFQRSFSTKRGRGRGIGTYSIRLFAERYLGGRVSFDSAEGVGTTFVVILPSLKRQRS